MSEILLLPANFQADKVIYACVFLLCYYYGLPA